MKLLLCLYLSSLFCSVCSLLCYQCIDSSGQCDPTISLECATGEVCAAFRTDLNVAGVESVTSVGRSCLAQSFCSTLNADLSSVTYSLNVGVGSLFGFISCCNTDNCNTGTITEHNTSPNGLKCYTCNSLLDTTCNTTVSCVGSEDHCANATIPDLSVFGSLASTNVKGCFSKSSCDAAAVANITCCSGNLCNGSEAWLRLDFSLLLMVLTATILFQ